MTHDSDREALGRRLRSDVLGGDADLSEGDGGFMDEVDTLLLEHGWADVWARPGLDLRTRSLVTVALLAVLGRQADLVLHTQGALRNGASREEIREVMLHVAIYAGFPLALAAIRETSAALLGPSDVVGA